jgi:glyceraldehyde 3-phosphate dehydrogenase
MIRVGIKGFGRMGRLAQRAGWGKPDLAFVQVNEVAGNAATAAHLLAFDSVHGASATMQPARGRRS